MFLIYMIYNFLKNKNPFFFSHLFTTEKQKNNKNIEYKHHVFENNFSSKTNFIIKDKT